MAFNEKGAIELEKITAANINNKMAVLVDGKILLCPVIATKISGGKLQVSMNIKQEQLDSIFSSLAGKRLNEE
jgi:preprotein translocase subunit SecD